MATTQSTGKTSSVKAGSLKGNAGAAKKMAWKKHAGLTSGLTVLGFNRDAYLSDDNQYIKIGRNVFAVSKLGKFGTVIEKIMALGKKVH